MTLPASTASPEFIERMRAGVECRRCGGSGRTARDSFCFICSGTGLLHHPQGEGQYSQDYGNLVVMWQDRRFYYCGAWEVSGENGMKGYIRLRPVERGEGVYTVTVWPGDVTEIGQKKLKIAKVTQVKVFEVACPHCGWEQYNPGNGSLRWDDSQVYQRNQRCGNCGEDYALPMLMVRGK